MYMFKKTHISAATHPRTLNLRGGGLVALLLLYCGCVVAVGVLRLFLVVPCVGLRCVFLVFPDL